MDVNIRSGGLYGLAKCAKSVGSLEPSSATYVKFCLMSGNGVSLEYR